MKRRVFCISAALTLLFSMTASAVPGTPENPVVTLRYLEDSYLPSVRTKASAAAGRKMDEFFALPRNQLSGFSQPMNMAALERKVVSRINFRADASGELRLKAGSALTLGQGARFHIISGSASHRSGTLTNASAGRDAAAGSALTVRNRYAALSAETGIRIDTDTVMFIQGSYRITPPYVPMYKDLCDALMIMGLINTYELARITTRAEMFTVFTRLLGAEAEAAAAPVDHPFADSPNWFDANLSYLYNRGLTTGTSRTAFSPDHPATVQQMCTILLRALGYRERIDFTYQSAVSDAVRLGLFTERETDILRSEEFTRDTMMYMIYYSLGAEYRGTDETMLELLIRLGQVDRSDAEKARATVVRKRF
jgi:hypothetical protein